MVTSAEFFSDEVRDDPYPFYARLRREHPVIGTDFGYWYVLRYGDANALLRDPRLAAGTGVADSFGLSEGTLYDIMGTWLMALDGPAHSRVRRLISRAFTPRAVEALRPAIEALAADIVDAMAAAGGGDVVADLAFAVPMEVVRLLFGAEPEEWDRCVTALFDPLRRPPDSTFLTQMAALADYFSTFVPARRLQPGDDMFSAMLAPDDGGDTLGDRELVANAVLLVTAGFETTMGLISLCVLTLLRHPGELARLREDPALVRNAVEEVLRFEPAALSTTRSVREDLTVAGTVVAAGSNLLFSFPAANRDPDRYADPDTFDVGRPDIRPLTFGAGAHACIGAALARMEAEVVLAALIERTSELELTTDPVVWQAENPTVRRPVELRVACRPANRS